MGESLYGDQGSGGNKVPGLISDTKGYKHDFDSDSIFRQSQFTCLTSFLNAETSTSIATGLKAVGARSAAEPASTSPQRTEDCKNRQDCSTE